MKLREASPCLNCEHLAQRVATLEDKLLQAMERIAKLEEENARLQQQMAAARKDSSTSSKPSSSDIVRPKRPLFKGGKKRKKGGQPGHQQHLRSPFPPEAVNHFEPHTLDCCPDCGGTLVLSRRKAEVLQQVEITDTPTVVTEHQGLAYWCPHCRKVHYGRMPEAAAKAGLFGPRLTALVAFMKGVCHASFSTIRKFLRDLVRVPERLRSLCLSGRLCELIPARNAAMACGTGFTRASMLAFRLQLIPKSLRMYAAFRLASATALLDGSEVSITIHPW